MSTTIFHRHATVDLDPSVLQLSENELQFLKQQTGIPEDQELMKHILQVQADAWKVLCFSLAISLSVLDLVIMI